MPDMPRVFPGAFQGEGYQIKQPVPLFLFSRTEDRGSEDLDVCLGIACPLSGEDGAGAPGSWPFCEYFGGAC